MSDTKNKMAEEHALIARERITEVVNQLHKENIIVDSVAFALGSLGSYIMYSNYGKEEALDYLDELREDINAMPKKE